MERRRARAPVTRTGVTSALPGLFPLSFPPETLARGASGRADQPFEAQVRLRHGDEFDARLDAVVDDGVEHLVDGANVRVPGVRKGGRNQQAKPPGSQRRQQRQRAASGRCETSSETAS